MTRADTTMTASATSRVTAPPGPTAPTATTAAAAAVAAPVNTPTMVSVTMEARAAMLTAAGARTRPTALHLAAAARLLALRTRTPTAGHAPVTAATLSTPLDLRANHLLRPVAHAHTPTMVSVTTEARAALSTAAGARTLLTVPPAGLFLRPRCSA